MARKNEPADNKDEITADNLEDLLKENKIASRFIKKPGESPNAIMISGFVSNSDDPQNIVRLYVDFNFDTYVDIPKRSILGGTKLPKDPLETVYLWVERGSDIKQVRITSVTRKAEDFLEGDIVRKYAQPTPIEQTMTASRLRPQAEKTFKPSWVDGCPSVMVICDQFPPPPPRSEDWTCGPRSLEGLSCPSPRSNNWRCGPRSLDCF